MTWTDIDIARALISAVGIVIVILILQNISEDS